MLSQTTPDLAREALSTAARTLQAECADPCNARCACRSCVLIEDNGAPTIPMTAFVIDGRFVGSLSASGF